MYLNGTARKKKEKEIHKYINGLNGDVSLISDLLEDTICFDKTTKNTTCIVETEENKHLTDLTRV